MDRNDIFKTHILIYLNENVNRKSDKFVFYLQKKYP